MHRLDCTKKTVSFSLYLMLPKPSDHCFLSKRHHKGLSHCKTPEISDHPFTSPPSPKEKKRGDPSSSPLEQASYCWAFCLMGWVCLPGKQYSTGLRPGTRGWPEVHSHRTGQLWECVTCERYGSLQVHQRHWAIAWKGRCMEIRCPHGCKAWIYCKQIMILAPRSASLDWEMTGH